MKLLRVVFLFFPLLALSAHASVLNSANAFGVLGASAVTNTGPSVVDKTWVSGPEHRSPDFHRERCSERSTMMMPSPCRPRQMR